MGEQMRSHIAACKSVHLQHAVFDVFRYAGRSDPDHRKLVEPAEVEIPHGGIRVFHVNGDEVEAAVQAFKTRGGIFEGGYNIVVPAWELPKYPDVWADKLRIFDEVWALSRFIASSLQTVGVSSHHIGQAVEVPVGHFFPRKYFGIRESAFAILHFFDLTSYATRKNPEAVLRMFESLRMKRPYDDIQLVLKVKKGDSDGEDWLLPVKERIPEVICLSQPMSAHETRSLINCCDCFASLHRSEGFGRGTGEAMFLGRLALATGWSGNMDYMTAENSLLVDHNLIPLDVDEYPFGYGQHWAEPNLEHAVNLVERALDDRSWGSSVAARGRRDICLGYSYRAVGLRISSRVTDIQQSLEPGSHWRKEAKPTQTELIHGDLDAVDINVREKRVGNRMPRVTKPRQRRKRALRTD
jgi:hypothetical protein